MAKPGDPNKGTAVRKELFHLIAQLCQALRWVTSPKPLQIRKVEQTAKPPEKIITKLKRLRILPQSPRQLRNLAAKRFLLEPVKSQEGR